MNKLTEWLIEDLLTEDVKLDLKVGDTILMGRFKNKKVKVKSIDYNDRGDLLINGRSALKFRPYQKDKVLLPNKKAGKDSVTKDPDMKGVSEAPRKPRKKGQHRNSPNHSDLYTDENPKGTIKGLKFATVKDAKASVSKIKNSGKSHAHKIQAAVAMEQRAKEMGKSSQAAVYRSFINKMKEKTKKKNEMLNYPNYLKNVPNVPGIQKDGEHRYYNPKTSKKKKKKKTEMAVPSPSRKGVEKMKKKGNTSVPYGSGYKKVNEANAVSGGKVSKFITGHNLTMKGKKYKEIEFETLGVDNSSKMVKLRILAPKNLFGKETPVKFSTLRRGPFTKTETGKKVNEDETKTIQSLLQKFGQSEKDAKKMLKKNYKKVNKKFKNQTPRDKAMALIGLSLLGEKNIKKTLDSYMENFVYSIVENTQIKKVIGIYGGRFQPFGPHHLKTYQWLESRVDEAYITTSDIKKPPRHPMNFNEKVRHMAKMGVPKNRIIKEATPYVAKNTLSKFDPNTTAVVYIFGKKDAGRLQGGTKKGGGKTYYQDYKQNKNNLVGFEEHGYILTAPHTSMSVAGMEISGTTMRKVLGSPKIKDEDRPKIFKKLFGYYDKGVYNMMTNKFKKLFEFMKNIKPIIKEVSTFGAAVANADISDEGFYDFFKNFSDYERVSPKHAELIGWTVIGDIINRDRAISPREDFTFQRAGSAGTLGAIDTVTFGKTVNQNTKNTKSVSNPFPKYEKHMRNMMKDLGWEVVKFMGKKTVDIEDSDIFDMVSSLIPKERDKTLKEQRELLLMGGAYGHMSHPFDDNDLTFGDLKNIITLGLGGKLDREDGVTEKLDGQNLMVCWIDGELKAARNKGHLKNKGATAPNTDGIKKIFAGRGNVEKAFVSSMKDLSKAIGSLSDKQKEKVFGNGTKWMNLEIMFPATANVVDYDVAEIVFHGTLEYDDSGRPIGQPKDSARMLAGMIKQVNANVQKTFRIGKPNFLKVPKTQDFGKKKNLFLGKLKKIQSEYALKDSNRLGEYHQAFWQEYVFNASKQFGIKLKANEFVQLVNRWAYFDKSYKIPMIKKDYEDRPKFLDWILSTDKNDHSKIFKDNIQPIETLFFEVGAEILKNISGYMAVNPDKTVQSMKKEVESALKDLKSGGNPEKLKKLKLQIEKLEAIGGVNAIVPTEGIVFKYKGNVYKFTGAFAPINQILGSLKFG